jgi:galactokinase
MYDARALAAKFESLYGRPPAISRAPGRVNLIGEHTDYNQGFVMPAALEFATLTAAAPRADGLLRAYSLAYDESVEFDLGGQAPQKRKDWSDYVVGVAVQLLASGKKLKGADLAIASDVPIGSGLSSSAALEVSVAHALAHTSGFELPLVEMALLCQRAENQFVGMQCGIMDQFIACRGAAGHALLIDCRSLEARLVTIPAHARLVVANSMVHHVLAGGSEYNARRLACEEGVRLLASRLGPIRALRDVSADALEAQRDVLPEVVYRRCRHIVTENERVLAAEAALGAGDLETCGHLMDASHVSMRDDFEISCSEVDKLVAIARRQRGVYGSRMTGGGFGGCTVSLVEAQALEPVMAAMREGYREATGLEATIFACSPAAGVGMVAI